MTAYLYENENEEKSLESGVDQKQQLVERTQFHRNPAAVQFGFYRDGILFPVGVQSDSAVSGRAEPFVDCHSGGRDRIFRGAIWERRQALHTLRVCMGESETAGEQL